MFILGISTLVGLSLGSTLPCPLIRGSFGGDQVHACGTWHERDTSVSPTGGGRLVLLRDWTTAGATASAHWLPIPVGLFGGSEWHLGLLHEKYGRVIRNPPLRWQVFGDRCYVMAVHSSYAGREVGGELLLDIQPWLVSFSIDAAWPWPAPPNPRPQGEAATAALNPLIGSLESFTWSRRILPPRESPISSAFPTYPGTTRLRHFDFLVVTDLLIEEYVLIDGSQLVLHKLRQKAETRFSTQLSKEPVMRVDWNEPFHVVANGDKRFVVTESGKVFAIPARHKESDPLKEIWSGSPVRALVTDSSSGKSYGYTTDRYFEIADEVKLHPHTIDRFRGRTADEVLETVTKCARVIRGLAPLTGIPVETAPPPRSVQLRR